MLEYTDESKRLVSTFLQYRNDIDIYTEDGPKSKEFYKVLMSRLLEDGVRIVDITPLGSKKNVIERCEKEPENGRSKIFIVDGDICIIHGSKIPKLKNLYVLDAYCIENLLLNKESIINFIYLTCASKSKEEVEDQLSFENWLFEYSSDFILLFLHFAILDHIEQPFKILHALTFHHFKKDVYNFSPADIQETIAKLKEQILEVISNDEYDNRLVDLQKKWNVSISTLLTIVSAKDYLIPVILLKCGEIKGTKQLASVLDVKFNLAQYCSLERLESLKNAIEIALKPR